MTNEERAMIDEINLMRSSPRNYVRYVRQYMNDFRNAGWGAAETREEMTAAEELIKELQRRLPLSRHSRVRDPRQRDQRGLRRSPRSVPLRDHDRRDAVDLERALYFQTIESGDLKQVTRKKPPPLQRFDS